MLNDPKPEDPKPEDPKPEDPKPEDPKPEDPKPEDPKPESEIVKKIKEDYEARLTEMQEQHKKELEDKDKLILEILDGNKKEPTSGIADKINQSRNFKKY